MSRQSGVSFSYLLTVGVVSFTRYSLLPWCLWNLNQRKYDSWTKVVPAYGLLLGSLQSGHALGQLLINLNVTSSLYSTAFFLLTSSYVCLCFIDRYSLLLMIFFTLGFSGSLLSGVSINLDKSVANIAFVRKPTDAELNNTIQRSIVSFAFSTLVSGYLYDSNPAVHFPLYRIMILITSACLLMSFYFCCIKSVARRKFQSQSNKSTGSSSSSQSSAVVRQESKPVGKYTGEVPENYLSWYNNDLSKAQAAYGKYLQWRQDYGMDTIWTTPQPGFHNILKFYPHAIHGYTLDGCAVCYELLGKGKANELTAAGVTIAELVRHFALRNELCFARLLEPDVIKEVIQKHPGSIVPSMNPRPAVRRLTVVLDLEGLGFFSVTSDVLTFMGQSGNIIDNYYPEQVARLLIVNAPSFFTSLWAVIVKVLPASVQKKVDFLKDVKDLDKYIHPSQRPKAYGGTSELDLGQADGHKAFLKLAEEWSNKPAPATNSSSSNSNSGSKNASQSKTSEATEQKNKGGMMGWFKSKLTKSSAPKEAFLGNKNSYRYNASTGVWELDFDDANTSQMDEDDDCDTVISFDGDQESGKKAPAGVAANTSMIISSSGSAGASSGTPIRNHSAPVSGHHSHKKMTAAQIEDHGLILAIQAAHVAKSYSSDNISAMDLSGLESGGGAANADSSSASGASTGAVHSQHADVVHGRVSSDIFMMVCSIHVLCASMHSMLTVLIPVWLMSQVSNGGLSYHVKDLALVLSTTSMVVLQFHVLLSSRLEYCLKASPVRTLRIACGILVSMCFVLPIYLNITTYDIGMTPNTASPALTTVVASSIEAVEESIVVHKDYHSHLLANVNHNLPSHSVITLIMTSLLCAVLFCASHVCRKATNILFHLTLHSSFSSPTTMRCIVNQIIEILTPILCTLLYASIYGMKLVYPMNSSFFLSFASCGFIFIYMCSILLTVNFRGDYGVMTDSPDGSLSGPTSLSRSTSREFAMGSQLRSRHTASGNAGSGWSGQVRSGNNQQSAESTQDVFSIPMGDLSLLFSQIAYSYGSKLHNLRDDYKDL